MIEAAVRSARGLFQSWVATQSQPPAPTAAAPQHIKTPRHSASSEPHLLADGQDIHRMSAPQVIVVGGGLAGLTAAHTVLENGGRVCLIDKARPKASLHSCALHPAGRVVRS